MREGWVSKSLGEIANVEYGFTAKADIVGYYRYVRITDINTNGEITLDEKRYVKQSKDSTNFVLKENDLLMARTGATFAKVLLYKDYEPSIFASYLIRINFKEQIVNKLYWYFSKSEIYWQQANNLSSGSAQPHFNGAALKKVIFICPKSLQEQQQIVTILDQAFEAIDQAKSNIEKNILNAKELFQSKLNDIFSQKGEGWEGKKFQDVCVLQRGFDLPTRLREKGKYDLVTSSGINDSHKDYKVCGPGVVTGRSGSIGNVFFVEKNFWPLNTALYIKDFKTNEERYVYYFLRAFDLSKYATGTGVPTLNRNFVHHEKVLSTNDINEQKEIIKVLDELELNIDEIEKQYQDKLNNLEHLKKSILQKAFAGELTAKEEVINYQQVAEATPSYSKNN